MVCPMCITAVVSQAAVPVASAVGGAIAAKAALLDGKKKSVAAAQNLSARTLDRRSPGPVLQTIDHDSVRAPVRAFRNDDRL